MWVVIDWTTQERTFPWISACGTPQHFSQLWTDLGKIGKFSKLFRIGQLTYLCTIYVLLSMNVMKILPEINYLISYPNIVQCPAEKKWVIISQHCFNGQGCAATLLILGLLQLLQGEQGKLLIIIAYCSWWKAFYGIIMVLYGHWCPDFFISWLIKSHLGFEAYS